MTRLQRTDEADQALKRLVEEYPASEWAKRARQRQTTSLTP
jgi:TolA-binding protein